MTKKIECSESFSYGLVTWPNSTNNNSNIPTEASVVHLQFDIAFAAHLLCALNLQTSHDKP